MNFVRKVIKEFVQFKNRLIQRAMLRGIPELDINRFQGRYSGILGKTFKKDLWNCSCFGTFASKGPVTFLSLCGRSGPPGDENAAAFFLCVCGHFRPSSDENAVPSLNTNFTTLVIILTSLLLTIVLRFTFGESKICSTIKKYQNIMKMIAEACNFIRNDLLL